MKKIIKNPFITFILGGTIFSSIIGVSAYVLLANNIGFNPVDTTWNVNDVDEALNDLYDSYTTLTSPKVEVVSVCSVESSTIKSCSGTLEVDKYYLCVVNTRNYNGTQTITGAQVLLNQENGAYLDYKYTTYRSFIKPTQTNVTFSISNGRGIGVVCYYINSGI
ncbi:MAG: hypothetical protein IJ572_05200 [Bacilli bacterium]|nr:hypothetical protein [Bacilli bacterium]